jgi:hypothetical protein
VSHQPPINTLAFLPPAIASILFPAVKDTTPKPSLGNDSVTNTQLKTASLDDNLYNEFFVETVKNKAQLNNGGKSAEVDEDMYADLAQDTVLDQDVIAATKPTIDFGILDDLDKASLYIDPVNLITNGSDQAKSDDLYGDLLENSSVIDDSYLIDAAESKPIQSDSHKSNEGDNLLKQILEIVEKIHNEMKLREDFDLVVTKRVPLVESCSPQSDPRLLNQHSAKSIFNVESHGQSKIVELKSVRFDEIAKNHSVKEIAAHHFDSLLPAVTSSTLVNKLDEARLLEHVMSTIKPLPTMLKPSSEARVDKPIVSTETPIPTMLKPPSETCCVGKPVVSMNRPDSKAEDSPLCSSVSNVEKSSDIKIILIKVELGSKSYYEKKTFGIIFFALVMFSSIV